MKNRLIRNLCPQLINKKKKIINIKTIELNRNQFKCLYSSGNNELGYSAGKSLIVLCHALLVSKRV